MDTEISIIDSLLPNSTYKSVTDRYFSRRYCCDVKGVDNNDHLLLFHSNRICVVTLAPSHPVFEETEPFVVQFQLGNVDRAKNFVKGKGKKGGQLLDVDSTLCKIVTNSGKEYSVSSCIKGKLLEINDSLTDSPWLLKQYPDSNGYVAVILSNIATSELRKSELLCEEKYLSMKSREAIKDRQVD